MAGFRSRLLLWRQTINVKLIFCGGPRCWVLVLPNPLIYQANLSQCWLFLVTRSHAICPSVCRSLSHTHKWMSYWPLTLTLLFMCFLVETGQGGGAASEGARMARRCDGKVGHPLFSLLPKTPSFLFSFLGNWFIFPLSAHSLQFSPQFSNFFSHDYWRHLMTMWSASQRQCGSKTSF